ncbi:hypothetical protein [Halorussus pelagicus]|uniref:hypothetical protein n=1 Tax=Halorussus pelagicus TaxID=2505977 RepID=UPI00140DA4B4|nr:hypothetical protein [Halorussus pelagicus]
MPEREQTGHQDNRTPDAIANPEGNRDADDTGRSGERTADGQPERRREGNF